MKNLGKLLIVTAVVACVSIPAFSTTFSLNPSQLQSFYEVYENPASSNTNLFPVQALANGAKYKGDINMNGSGWSQIQIGANFWGQPYGGAQFDNPTLSALGLSSLSGFDKFSEVIENQNENAWKYNLFFNVGYTDWGETNYYVQNTWTEIAAGGSQVMTLDFSNAQVYGGAYSGDWKDLNTIGFNWDHISSIGLNIGADVPLGADKEDYTFETKVSPVPEPATLLLLGFGLLAVGLVLRKQQ